MTSVTISPFLAMPPCYAVKKYQEKAMTAAVQEILSTFDNLLYSERIDLLSEILKRTVDLDFPPLSDEDLALNAEHIFLALEEQESQYE